KPVNLQTYINLLIQQDFLEKGISLLEDYRDNSPAVQFLQAHFVFKHKGHSGLGAILYVRRIGEVTVGINIAPADFKFMMIYGHFYLLFRASNLRLKGGF